LKGNICAAVDASSALGLKLAGVGDVMTWTKGDDAPRLRDWFRTMNRSGMGVMVLSSQAAEQLSAELLEKRASGRVTPVVVVLPGEEEDRRTREMMRRAVGLDHGTVKGGRS
jgi:vacuolar-type H+-ATPase subunit F/Vma7